METSNFRTDIERLAKNCKVMVEQFTYILSLIDKTLPRPSLKRDGNIIHFPGAWQEQKTPEKPKPF
jgi:hypothetical protein